MSTRPNLFEPAWTPTAEPNIDDELARLRGRLAKLEAALHEFKQSPRRLSPAKVRTLSVASGASRIAQRTPTRHFRPPTP